MWKSTECRLGRDLEISRDSDARRAWLKNIRYKVRNETITNINRHVFTVARLTVSKSKVKCENLENLVSSGDLEISRDFDPWSAIFDVHTEKRLCL